MKMCSILDTNDLEKDARSIKNSDHLEHIENMKVAKSCHNIRQEFWT
jgi:hypothetical protein